MFTWVIEEKAGVALLNNGMSAAKNTSDEIWWIAAGKGQSSLLSGWVLVADTANDNIHDLSENAHERRSELLNSGVEQRSE